MFAGEAGTRGNFVLLHLCQPFYCMRCALLLLGFCILVIPAYAQQTPLLAAGRPPQGEAANPGADSAAMLAPAPVYHAAEEMPAFPGGPAAYLDFMRRTLRYPDAALNASLSGKVHVRFTVDEQGRLLDPEIAKGLGGGLDQEALRLVRLMPWWTPGKIAGRPVRVRYVLPIMFRSL